VFRDVSVWNTTVTAGSDAAELTALAVKHATDRRGVAHLAFPDEVQVTPSGQEAQGPQGRTTSRRTRPDGRELAAAVAAVQAASRPVVVAGHGARGAREELVRLAERLGAPSPTC